MVDNTVLNSGSGGDTIATDDIGGVKHQRVKIQYGTDGNATDVSDSNPLPIDDAGGSITVDGTVTANAGTGTFNVDGSGVTQPISAASLPLPTGAATAANQLPDGHNVTVDNASGASAVNIQDGGNSITVDNGGTFAVQDDNSENLIDTNNSTTTPLGISGVFTGTGTDVSAYSAVAVTLRADQDSATDGMTFQFSTDNTNWDDVYPFNMDVSSSNTRRFQFPVTAQYFRVVYTNGTSAQSIFRVQTILHRRDVATSIHRLVDDTSLDRSAAVVKSAIIAQTAGASSDFTPVQATNGGNLKISVEEFGASLPAGTNNIGDVDVLSIAAGSNLVGDVGIGVRTSGGTTLYKNIDVDESEDQIKGTAGQVYWIHAMNLASGTRFLKLYNATAASVTVGTTTPDLTFPLPTQGDTNGAGFTLSIPNGIAFGTAITIAATTGVADNDSGAPGANEVVVNLGYA